MKLKHSIVRIRKNLRGHILEVKDFKRGFGIIIKENSFCISSEGFPELVKTHLFIHGIMEKSDDDFLQCKYKTEKEAQEMLDFINKHSL